MIAGHKGLLVLSLMAALTAAITGCSPGAQPPLRNPDKDWAASMAQCLRGIGWDVDVEEGDKLHAKVPTGQEARYTSDVDSCRTKLGYRKDPQVDADEAGRLYDELVHVADCVRQLGLPVVDPPDKQTYVDAITHNKVIWHPYQGALAASPGPGTQQTLEQSCPIPASGS